MKIKIYEYKSETFSFIDMQILNPNSDKSPSSYDQPSDGLIKFPLLKSPEKYSHSSKFTKHLPFMTLGSDTLLQIKKWWDAILSTY